MRVDKFLITHLRAIPEDIKITGNLVDNTLKKKKNYSTSFQNF